MAIERFNIRVYGILENAQGEVLVVTETIDDFTFTKFPGGGLEFGEGLVDGLKRELQEELDLQATIGDHFYTTDFFQASAFRKTEQLISIYYRVLPPAIMPNLDSARIIAHPNGRVERLSFAWVSKHQLDSSLLTFPVDQKVGALLQTFSAK